MNIIVDIVGLLKIKHIHFIISINWNDNQHHFWLTIIVSIIKVIIEKQAVKLDWIISKNVK